MKKNIAFAFVIFVLLSACSEGEFNADGSTIISLIRPNGLCEGGIEGLNNTLTIPFEWSVDGDSAVTEFTLEIVEKDNEDAEPQIVNNIDGQLNSFEVTLERGKYYIWKVSGNLNGGAVVTSPDLEFYSESIPDNDQAPLPSQILIRELQNAFEVSWTNDRENVDNLSYQVWLSGPQGLNATIGDVTQLNYVPQGSEKDESAEKIQELSKNELNANSDYIVRLETIKVVNRDITNRTFSYLKFTNR